MTENLIPDLDATIAAAVNARIEAEVFRALSGDEVIGRFVTSALRATVTVKNNRTYREEQVPFLTHTLQKAIRAATEEAVKRLLLEEMPKIEAEIATALRRDVKGIAAGLAASLKEAADQTYGVKVELNMPSSS